MYVLGLEDWFLFNLRSSEHKLACSKMSNRNDSTHFLVSITYDWRDLRRVETANAALFASHHVSQPIFSFADPCIAVAPEICGPLNEV